MADAVDAAVSSIGLQRFVAVGHSYGGAVVATYAARHPEKVAAVIYADSAASVSLTPEQKKQFIDALRANRMRIVRQWFAPMLKASAPAVQERIFAAVEKSTVDAFGGALAALASYDANATVNAYHGPRFVIAAADIETPASFRPQFPDFPSVKDHRNRPLPHARQTRRVQHRARPIPRGGPLRQENGGRGYANKRSRPCLAGANGRLSNRHSWSSRSALA